MLEVVEAGARMERREMVVDDSPGNHDLQGARSSDFRGPKLFPFSSISLFCFGTRPGEDQIFIITYSCTTNDENIFHM